jgi:Undecaprenyl-phosphate glucose phosphotransferase
MSTNYVNGALRSLTGGTLDGADKALAKRTHSTISYRAVAPLAMVCDAVIISSTSVISAIFYSLEINAANSNILQFSGFAAIVAALFIAFGKTYGIYNLTELLNLKSELRKVATTWVAVFLFLTGVVFIMKEGSNFSRGTVLVFAVFGLVVLGASRVAWRAYLAGGLAVRRFSNRKIAVLEEQNSTGDLQIVEALRRHGLEPACHFLLPTSRSTKKQREEIVAKFIASIRGSDIEEIIVTAQLHRWPQLTDLLAQLRVLPLPVNLIPVGPLSELFKLSFHSIGDTVTVELQRGPQTLTERAIKRAFDVLVAVAALIIFMPLLLVVAAGIKLDSPGPIIFRQWRRGFNGIPFQILKFRTMSVQEDGENIIQAKPNDVRVTRFGNWLRRTSIDELPQLLNVLNGSMSVVGPRPHAMAHDNEFDKLVSKYAYRHHVKPGLTGWAQVNGYRGPTNTVADIEQRIRFDLWYIDNWSPAIDFKILVMTASKIVVGENAY